MPVRCINEKFRCDVCGNEVMVIQVGGGILVCCSQEMQPDGLQENTPRKEDSLQ